MTTAGGGWTLVYSQSVSSAQGSPSGYDPKSAWMAGLNVNNPQSDLYSILYAIPSLEQQAFFELRLAWPLPTVSGSLIWTQASSPLSSTTPPSINVEQAAPGNSGYTFDGLWLCTNSSAYVCGANEGGNYYYAVGEVAGWPNAAGGIPAWNGGTPAVETQLWIR